MAFLYTLRTPAGDQAGEVRLAQPARPGEEIQVPGNGRMLILSVFSVEQLEEILGRRPTYGIIWVEPIGP